MNIYVNQWGYQTHGIKRAVLAQNVQALVVNRSFAIRILDSRGECVLEREAVYIGLDADSNDIVFQVDFTELCREGNYRIESPYGDVSGTFRISDEIYGELTVPLAKTYYFQRCGMDLEEKFAGVFQRRACHLKKAVLLEDYRKMEKGALQDEISFYEVTGGWHDAGDYGRYTTAGASAVAHLLYAWQWFPGSFSRTLNIPESGSGMDDILWECQYELNWLLKMQREDGAVFHKLTSMRHANFVMPQKDNRQMILFPVSSFATGAFAAVTALAARVYRPFDKTFSKRMLEASKKAWRWLEENQEVTGFQNPVGCNTGEYDDDCDTDERLWAASELYISTRDMEYLEKACQLKKNCGGGTGLGWRDVTGFSGFAFLEEEIKEGIREEDLKGNERELLFKHQYYSDFLKEAEDACELSEKNGYWAAMRTEDFEWGSNMNLLTRGMVLALAWNLTGRKKYLDAAVSQMDYLLGVNAAGYSYVTGIGEKSVHNIHNRITVADGIDQVIPGYVSGGPNSHPVDEKAEWLIEPGTPPMKCFLDIWECYSLNEVTIYWNSPAVFLAAFLDSVRTKE